MNIIVCMKQVPDTTEVKIDPKTGRLIREGVPSIINPEDKNAIEAALDIRGDGKVTVLTMGPPQAEDALREALAMGVDDAILMGDVKFAGSDTWATANAIAFAIKKIGSFDLIMCGRQAIDGDTAQVGPQLAENLQLPQISYVEKIEAEKDKITVHRGMEDGYEIIETELPALITVTKDINTPRYPSLQGIHAAFNDKEITRWNAADVEADLSKVGILNSPTKVKKTFSPSPKGSGEKIEGKSAKEKAKKIIDILKSKEILQEF